jgi:PAS domain-containing protein
MPPPDDHREIRRGPLEHFADRLVAGMSDAIVYADAEGVIRLWNRGATRVFGFTETEALGRSLVNVCVSGTGAATGPPCVPGSHAMATARS